MVTDDIFISYLNCQRKAHFKAAGVSGERAEFEAVQLGMDRSYREQALAVFLGSDGEAAAVVDPPSLQAALRGQPRVIVNATAEAHGVRTQFHALERIGEASRRA